MLVDRGNNYENEGYEIEEDSNDSEIMDEFLKNLDQEEVMKCYHRNDSGDAEIYRKLSLGKFLYHVDKRMWYKFVGPHWEPDYRNEAIRNAELIVEIYKHFIG